MRKIIALMLVFVIGLTLCACHGNKEQKIFDIPDSF